MRDVERMKKNEQFSTHLGFQEHSPLGFSLHDPIQCFEIPPCSVPSRSSAAHQCWLQGHGRRAQERWSSLSWLALATGIALMLEETSVLIHSYWAHPLPAETKMTVQPEAAV